MATTRNDRSVVVIGAGGHGREVLDVIEALVAAGDGYRVVGFIDDAPRHRDRIDARGVALLGGFEDRRVEGSCFVVGVGSAAGRRALVARAEGRGLVPLSLCHPSAVRGSVNTEGDGLIVFPLVSYTTNITFGRHVHLNRNATIGHDCVVGDFVTVNPGAQISGEVRLGNDVTIGTGASIIQGVEIGAGTTVGAGSVVTRDLPPGVVAIGAPARPVRALGEDYSSP